MSNQNSTVRNLYFDFNTYTGAYQQNFICYATGMAGKVKNCYFYIKANNKVGQDYGVYVNSSNLGSIENCTLYFDTNTISAVSWFYKTPLYKNCITNFEISKTIYSKGIEPENILVKDIQGNILNTKNDSDIINAQAGVYFGEYAWK